MLAGHTSAAEANSAPFSDRVQRGAGLQPRTREAMGALTAKWRELGHDVGFGIGIAHGYATLGTIGFEGRFDYAAIGTVSNVATRLCDEAKTGQILISPRVFMAVKDAVTVEPVGEFTLKGMGVLWRRTMFSPLHPQMRERRMRGRRAKVHQLSSRQSLRQISSLVTA